MSLEELRRQYTLGGLVEVDAPSQPLELFTVWLETARESAPADWVDPYAMTLATSTPSGDVSARVVLLRGFDVRGFVFLLTMNLGRTKNLRPIRMPLWFSIGDIWSDRCASLGP